MERGIEALSEDVRSKLRSSVVLPSLPAVLVELVQNSLDAAATNVVVTISLDRMSLRCADNGHGMLPSELRDLVGSTRYATSKDLGKGVTFGFRGEALASTAAIGALEIVSRRGVEGDAGKVVFRDGRSTFVTCRKDEHPPGTTVVVRDIFHKWPVRRRQLATTSSRNALLATLRQQLAELTLLHPTVSFSLFDSSTDERRTLLQVVKSPEGVLGRWKQLWGRTLVDDVEFLGLDPTRRGGQDESAWRCEGFLSKSVAHSKSHQFIFVNSRALSSSTSPLHKAINALVAQSSLSRHASTSLTPCVEGFTPSKRRSPRKAAELRHPVYVLSLKLPDEEVDVTLEPEKREVLFRNEDKLVTFVVTAVRRALVKLGYLSAPVDAGPSTSSAFPAVTTKLTSHFASMHRSFSGPPLTKRALSTSIQAIVLSAADDSAHDAPVQPIEHRDPLTGCVSYLDPRTGNTLPSHLLEHDSGQDGTPRGSKRPWDGVVDKRRLRRTLSAPNRALDAPGSAEQDADPPEWLQQSLRTWENPILPSSTHVDQIPVAPTCCPGETTTKTHFREVDAFFRSTWSDGTTRVFEREALKQASVIAQVDNKFILASLPSSSHDGVKTLVMIDQHAASERVRVEKLFKRLCRPRHEGGVETLSLGEGEGGVPILVTRQESAIIASRVDMFQRWGLDISVPFAIGAESVVDDFAQVRVHIVPSVVGERLQNESKLLTNLVRTYVAQLDDIGDRMIDELEVESGSGEAWISRIRTCPTVLLDLVNSKACRGAIMFNDPLSQEQMERLMQQLSETAFPFMCAHGRPSLVPLANAPSKMTATAGSRKRGLDWSSFEERVKGSGG